MKLHDAAQPPNPFRVRAFLAEKDLRVPLVPVDLSQGAQRTPAFLRLNGRGEVPVLELDDGTTIAESMAICRYLEELHPEPALLGGSALERARVEMWNRRVELHLFNTIGAVALHTIPFFAGKVEQQPAYAAAQRRAFDREWRWFDGELADGRRFLAGDAFTVADITAMAALRLGDLMQAVVPAGLTHAKRWESTVRDRPSWRA